MPERFIELLAKAQGMEWLTLVIGMTQGTKSWVIDNAFDILKLAIVSIGALFALYATFSSLVTNVEANTRAAKENTKVLQAMAIKLGKIEINQAILSTKMAESDGYQPTIQALTRRVDRIEMKMSYDTVNIEQYPAWKTLKINNKK